MNSVSANSPVGSNPAKSNLDGLGFLVVDASRLLRAAFERRISQAGLGLTPGEARALVNIADADGSRQLDIAARMGVEPMTLCAYLDKLQAMGLIERQQCFADRRVKRIVLTTESAAMLAAIRTELHTITSQATEGISDRDAGLLNGAMAIFNANLMALAESPALQADKDDR